VGGDGGGVSNGPPIDILGGRWVVMEVSNGPGYLMVHPSNIY
jgi:hypothetical protein